MCCMLAHLPLRHLLEFSRSDAELCGAGLAALKCAALVHCCCAACWPHIGNELIRGLVLVLNVSCSMCSMCSMCSAKALLLNLLVLLALIKRAHGMAYYQPECC